MWFNALLSKSNLVVCTLGLIFSGSNAFAYKTVSTRIVESPIESISESHPIVRAIDLNQKAPVIAWIRSGHSLVTRINNKLKEKLLDRAASHGSDEVFEALLVEVTRTHESVKFIDSRGTPLLIGLTALAMPGQKHTLSYERMIEALLQCPGIDVNAADRAYIGDGRTALHQAAASGNVKLIRTFIAHGAKVNVKNSSGESPLHLAARFGHIDAVRYLIYSSAEINEKTIYTKATPLMAAAEVGHASIIRLLMASGAKKGDKDTFGKTAPERYKEYSSAFYARNPSVKP
jgi:ankyrin repeat protein